MKKAMLTIWLVGLLALMGCSLKENKNEDTKSAINGDKNSEATTDKIEEKNVEVTLPAILFEGADMDDILAEAKEDGIVDVHINEDASVTYKMSKEKQRKKIEEARTGAIEYIEMLKSEDFPHILDVEHDDSFTEFTIIFYQATYDDDFNYYALMGLGMAGILYQSYDGSNLEDLNVKISIVDESSKDVLDTINYPWKLEGMD